MKMLQNNFVVQFDKAKRKGQNHRHSSEPDYNHLKKTIKDFPKRSTEKTKKSIGSPTVNFFYDASITENKSNTYSSNKPKHSFSLRNEIDYLKDEIEKIKQMLTQFYIAPTKEDDEMYEAKDIMEKLEKANERIHNIEKSVAVIEEKTKKLDEIPSKSEVKNIVIEAIGSKDIPNRSDVELKISRARNAQIIWTVSTIAVAVGVIIRFV